MHCMLMDLLHGFEVLSTTEETLFDIEIVLMAILQIKDSVKESKFWIKIRNCSRILNYSEIDVPN